MALASLHQSMPGATRRTRSPTQPPIPGVCEASKDVQSQTSVRKSGGHAKNVGRHCQWPQEAHSNDGGFPEQQGKSCPC